MTSSRTWGAFFDPHWGVRRKMAALPLPVAILGDLICGNRKWGHPRWPPEAEGPPFSSSLLNGDRKTRPILLIRLHIWRAYYMRATSHERHGVSNHQQIDLFSPSCSGQPQRKQENRVSYSWSLEMGMINYQGFPSQRDNEAEYVSISWRHHVENIWRYRHITVREIHHPFRLRCPFGSLPSRSHCIWIGSFIYNVENDTIWMLCCEVMWPAVMPCHLYYIYNIQSNGIWIILIDYAGLSLIKHEIETRIYHFLPLLIKLKFHNHLPGCKAHEAIFLQHISHLSFYSYLIMQIKTPKVVV